MVLKTIYLDYNDTILEENLIICLGFFDGLHKAHQALIRKAQLIKQERNYQLAVLTFDQSIKLYMQNKPFYYLTSVDDKKKILEKFDVDILYVMKVSYDLISLSAQKFIDQFLTKIKACVVGEDFTYGYLSKGKVDLLKIQPYFDTFVIKEITYHGFKIGSTRVRENLDNGQLAEANFLLGREYTITGTVIKGKGIGKVLGFPTANIDFTNYLLPKKGVYFTRVIYQDKSYYALTNVGKKPTFKANDISVEAYIYDLDKNLYGQEISIQFIEFMRDEYYFDTLEGLIHQIEEDRLLGLKLIEKERNKNEKIK